MRKPNIIAVIAISAMIIALLSFLIISGDSNDKCKITATNDSIRVDGTTEVTFETDDFSYSSHDDLTWTSEDETIASVSDDGIVRGISAGTTEITGTYDDLTSSISITVVEKEAGGDPDTPQVLPDPPTVDNPAQFAKNSGSDVVYFDSTTGHAYALFNYNDLGLFSFDEWELFCETLGGHLAIIDSEEENSFLYNSLRGTYNTSTGENMYSAFFGYTDQDSEGNWYWLYSSDNYEPNWAAGQPNNSGGGEDYALFFKDTMDGKWNDSKIGVNSYWFICEWEY